MVQASRTFPVRPPLATVRDYLSDFATAEAWDPGTVTCVRLTDGPVGVGTEWRNVSVFNRRETTLVYRLERVEDALLVFVGRNKTATSTDTISFVPLDEGGTSITYHARVEFNGLAKLADPFLRKEANRLMDELVDTMTTAVDTLG